MYINKLILRYVLEIFLVTLFLVVTYPVWQVLGESKGATIAEYYEDYKSDNITYYIDKTADMSGIYPMNDKDVDMSNYTSVNVVNNSKTDKDFKLVMAIEKNSDLKPEYLKISINGVIYSLSDLYYSSDNYLNYYIIEENVIMNSSVNTSQIVLWLQSDTPNEMQNKSLNFNYKIL